MSITRKEVDFLREKIGHAWEMLSLTETEARIRLLEDGMVDPAFWQDGKKAREISQELSNLKDEYKEWKTLRQEADDLAEMVEMAIAEDHTDVLVDAEKQLTELTARFQKMELKTLFSGDYDAGNALVSIHAGAGGTDAMDWAGMLVRMLVRFCEQQGWVVEVIHESRGEEAGFKSITFSVRGRFAFGYLKSEHGVHRLVRVSPFDAEQMRHTAFAQVEVIPEVDELSEKQLEIDPKELRIDTFMAGGHGGQSVNTTYSAVRITHIPTNTVVTCQNERSQVQNRETAMRVLKSRLFKMMQDARLEHISDLRGAYKSAEWGSQIRSYVVHPYKMVKDHRTDHETTDVEAVLEGDLMPFMEAYLRQTRSEQS